MPRGPLQNAAYQRARRAASTGLRAAESAARRQHREKVEGLGTNRRPFIGCDGEGGNTPDGKHHYYILTIGDQSLETGRPLTPEECLEFIVAQPAGPCYVAYYFDYDVTMMVRGLPEERVRRLLDREVRTRRHPKSGREVTYPVDVYDRFQIDYLPHKEFKVRRLSEGKPAGKWRVISDVGTFFQCAFLKALEQWEIGTPEERDMIATGKLARSDFADLTPETRAYNALEITLLQTLMERFRNVCEQVDYVPSRWQGPGNMASTMLRRHRVPRTRDLDIPRPVIAMADNAYYGGRFETTIIGPCYGGTPQARRFDDPLGKVEAPVQWTGEAGAPIYQYDICSAYPAAMRVLPCLLHGTWTRRGDMGSDKYLVLAHGGFKATPRTGGHAPTLYSLPVRNQRGSISYPAEGVGTYWNVEYEGMPHQTFTPDDWWSYEIPACICKPFGWIEEVYQQRLALGKTARGKVLKLGLNSLYGKQAQSIGAAPYANPVYAGLITAMTRATLSRAAHGGPECCRDCYMLATDAVFTGSPRDLDIGRGLGQWEEERHASLWIVQPGLYFTDKTDMPKTRGIPRQAAVEARPEFERILWGDGMDSVALPFNLAWPTHALRNRKVPVSLRQFVGIRIATHQGHIERAGEWVNVVKEISYDVSTKRDLMEPGRDMPAGDFSEVYLAHPDPAIDLAGIRTIPKPGGPDVESVPYSKDIGNMLRNSRLDLADQPDFSPVLFGEEM